MSNAYGALLLAVLSLPVAAQSPLVEDLSTALSATPNPSVGVSWGDYDSDGDLDAVVVNIDFSAQDILYRNEGGSTYTSFAFDANEDPDADNNAVVWADVDNDGDLDLIAASLFDGSVLLNQVRTGGAPVFQTVRTIVDRYENVRDAPVADFNGDGLLDVALLRRSGQRSVLLRNAGTAVVQEFVGSTRDAVSGCWGDVNNDGWPDLYVTNSSFQSNEFGLNQDGMLGEAFSGTPFVGMERSAGCSWGDYDGDEDLDLFVANVDGVNRLFRNDGGSWTPIGAGPGGEPVADSRGSAWGDVDNDGDLDLVVTRVDTLSTLYLNDGIGAFTAIAFGSATDGEPVATTLVDEDGDGDLDLFTSYGGYNLNQRNRFYRNTTDGGANWLEVDLHRPSGGNRFGIGALVTAYATLDGSPRAILRSVETRSGRFAQSGNRLHFGLGDAATVDSLVVAWPRGVDEARTVLYDVAANQRITVTGTEGFGASRASAGESPIYVGLERVHPNPSAGVVTVTWRAAEAGPVELEVLDVLGRRVVVERVRAEAGASVALRWGGADTPGVYLLRIHSGQHVEVVPVTIVR